MFTHPLLGDPFYFYVETNIFRNRLQDLKKKMYYEETPQ